VYSSLIIADISFAPDPINCIHEFGGGADREAERENGSLMGALAARTVALYSECERSKLKGRVVGDTKSPVWAEGFNGCIGQIAFYDGQQILYLLATRFVRYQPSIS
jgi:hypothetical protein